MFVILVKFEYLFPGVVRVVMKPCRAAGAQYLYTDGGGLWCDPFNTRHLTWTHCRIDHFGGDRIAKWFIVGMDLMK